MYFPLEEGHKMVFDSFKSNLTYDWALMCWGVSVLSKTKKPGTGFHSFLAFLIGIHSTDFSDSTMSIFRSFRLANRLTSRENKMVNPTA